MILDGKIVQERLIKAGDSVSVGASGKSTFVVPKTHLGAAEHRVFKASGGGYVLHLTDRMKGKISSGGAVVSLDRLARDPSVFREGGGGGLPLTQQDRGKIILDGVTLLFQFVESPPSCVATPLQQMDFRPRLLEDDDPTFLGFLGIWSALAMVLVVWVWNAEPQAFEMTDLPERIAKLTVPPRVIAPDIEPQVDEEADTMPVDVAREPVPMERVADHPAEPIEPPRSEAQVRDEVLKQSKLFAALLGTTADSTRHAADIWSEDEKGLADIDAALANAQGVTTASIAGLRSGGGGGGPARAADIGDLLGVGGGRVDSIAGPTVTIEGTVKSGSGEIVATHGDVGQIERTIRNYAGHLSYCYEKRLKVIPGLEGRVELSWDVADGAVVGNPMIVVNTTGDTELAKCVQQKIRRWRFEGFEGEAHNPFIFQAR